MKHFKLFLLPLLAMTLVFSSCEQQDLSLTYIEPIQDWGKSPQDILEKMTKSQSEAKLIYSETYEEEHILEYLNYGISTNLVYIFENERLTHCYTSMNGSAYKQTVKDYLNKKFISIEVFKDEDSEAILYHNKKKTTTICAHITEDGIVVFYIPYSVDWKIEDFG